mgnify:CR=1 FL=1
MYPSIIIDFQKGDVIHFSDPVKLDLFHTYVLEVLQILQQKEKKIKISCSIYTGLHKNANRVHILFYCQAGHFSSIKAQENAFPKTSQLTG